jgi:hypothetical protein
MDFTSILDLVARERLLVALSTYLVPLVVLGGRQAIHPNALISGQVESGT